MGRKLTQEDIIAKIEKVHGKKFTVLEEIKNTKSKTKIKCNECGYIWRTQVYSLYSGHDCPSCLGRVAKTTDIFKKEVYKLVGNEYTVLGEYKSNKTPILMKHNKCGNIYKVTPKNFLIQGQRCPKERYIKSAKSNILTQGKPELKNTILKEICIKEGYKIIKGYENNKIKLELKCEKCNNVYKVRPYDFISLGVRCPCNLLSKGERVIEEYLKKSNIKYEKQYRFNDCKGKEKRLPFDFAIFINNKLIALIEFDGLQHFYPKWGEKTLNEIKNTDRIKNKYCEDNNIPLIRVKYNHCTKYENFKNKVIEDLEASIIKVIPSETNKKLLGRVTTR